MHEDFRKGDSAYTDVNSIDYVVELRGDGDHQGLFETFDGTDYFSYTEGASKSLKTLCHKVRSDQDSRYTWTGIFGTVHTEMGDTLEYRHYHTFSGELTVRLEDRTTPNPPAAGRYSSYIYVHVIGEDG